MNKDAIKKELAMRELARRKLEYFTKYTKPDYEMIATQWGRHIHKQIIEKLEAVERGEIKRLMIFCPPRLGKSELVSKRFPAWCLGKNPKRNIVVSSYWFDLASDFGRKARQIVDDEKFKKIFPDFSLSQDKREGGNWETTLDWWYYSVGVGGALTGKWFDIGIIDDPVKNREEAESSTIQKRNIDWFTSTFWTRKKTENSAIIVMATRWNLNDLPGMILDIAKDSKEHWDILVIKGIDDEWHEIVWEWKWSEWYMKNEKANLSAKDWSALYQQDQIASSSNILSMKDLRYFLMSDFERADWILKKDDLKCRIYVDPAFSTNASSDDAVIIWLGKHKITNNKYILDGYAETSAPSKTHWAILAMYEHLTIDGFKIEDIVVEDVTINKDQTKFISDLKKFLKEQWKYIPVRSYNPMILHPKMKKEDRIKFILEPQMSLNAVYVRSDMPDKSFLRRLEQQITDFPHGRYDDIIDTITMWVDDIEKNRMIEEKEQPRAFFNPISGKIEVAWWWIDRAKMFGL